MEVKYDPCIGCGHCCTTALCVAGLRIYPGAQPPCPALRWTGEKNVCSLMEQPGSLGELYRRELYAGEGCCANLNSWRREPLKDRTTKGVVEKVSLPVEMQVFIKSLAGQFISSDTIALAIGQFQHELSKRGYSDEAINAWSKECAHCFNQNRSSRFKEFMG